MQMGTGNQQTSKGPTLLQVMICTYGREGLERVAAGAHPPVDGVEYMISCQDYPGNEAYSLPKALLRDDFRIFTTNTKGLSVNRNIALANATAPLLLISDDDVDYTAEGLRAIIDAFNRYPDIDILTFRYVSASHVKSYPKHTCSLAVQVKECFMTSFEIAFRRKSVQGRIWFNQNFGIGATFPFGEEDIFLRDCLDAGLKGIFEPVTIARHDGPTTSGRNLMLSTRPMTKGAVFMRLHPYDWPLRMMTHAIREIPLWRKGLVPSPLSYCLNWLRGAWKARRMKVFSTPYNPPYHQSHDGGH